MTDYKLKDSTKTAMRHILQDSATKRTNPSLCINEELHFEYKLLADQLIADLNQTCRNEVAMMLFNADD